LLMLITTLANCARVPSEEDNKKVIQEFLDGVLENPSYNYIRRQKYIKRSDTVLTEKMVKKVDQQLRNINSLLTRCENLQIVTLEEYNRANNYKIKESQKPETNTYYFRCKDEKWMSIAIHNGKVASHSRNLRTGEFLYYY